MKNINDFTITNVMQITEDLGLKEWIGGYIVNVELELGGKTKYMSLLWKGKKQLRNHIENILKVEYREELEREGIKI